MCHIQINNMEHRSAAISVATACAITQMRKSPPIGLLIFAMRNATTICNAVIRIIPLKTMRHKVKRLANKIIYTIFIGC